MSQIYKDSRSSPMPPSVATTYVTDSGNAVPAANILNVIGGAGCSTTGSGNTVTVVVDGTAVSYVNVTNAMSPYVVTATDYFISCDTTAGDVIIQLPNAPTQYDQFVVKYRTGTLPNTVTVTTVGGVVTIDESTSQVMADKYEALELLYNGSGYESF